MIGDWLGWGGLSYTEQGYIWAFTFALLIAVLVVKATLAQGLAALWAIVTWPFRDRTRRRKAKRRRKGRR